MAKQSGLGDTLFIGGYQLGDDFQSATGRGGCAVLNKTGITKSAMERIGGVRDGALEGVAAYNDTAGQAHPRLSLLPTADGNVTYCRGTSLGSPALFMVAKQINYDPTRAQDGDLTIGVSLQANGYGSEWGRQLTAGTRTDTAATNGTSVDFAASSAFGLTAMLHVFSFAGTDVTVKLQESSDNGAGDAWADVTGGGFTQITAGPTSQRIQTARGLTVERYLRVVTVTTGGFTSLAFAVTVAKPDVAVVF
jgi:hypothetical protein